ncbi:MAG: hypothetical protein FVQ81_14200 [Candidatus Glassbacteria bacterium]|nr:hypothetical protein [Candidatus Glassbacteria bacterium]
MNANLPILQLLGAAIGSAPTAGTAGTPAGGQSPFSGILGSLLGAAGDSAMPSADGSSSGTTGIPFESLLSALQSLQISPELLSDLNTQRSGGSMVALTAELAEMLSGIGGGRMVPLAAGIDLEQLGAAGIELPDGVKLGGQDSRAMLLVDEAALKSLLAGGGWKSGESVPAMLIVATGQEDGEQSVSYLTASLSASAGDESGEGSTLQFRLTFDPAGIISESTTAEHEIIGLPVTASGGEKTTVLELGALVARLKTAIGSINDKEITSERSNPDLLTIQDDETQLRLPSRPEANTVANDKQDTDGQGQPSLPISELAAELNRLIDSFVTSTEKEETVSITGSSNVSGDITGPSDVSGDITGSSNVSGDITGSSNVSGDITGPSNVSDDFSRAITVLKVLTGQAASEVASGNTEAAGKTLTLIDKLARFNQLSAAEKQQVLTDLAGLLRSVLDSGQAAVSNKAKTVLTPAGGFDTSSSAVAQSASGLSNITAEHSKSVPAGQSESGKSPVTGNNSVRPQTVLAVDAGAAAENVPVAAQHFATGVVTTGDAATSQPTDTTTAQSHPAAILAELQSAAAAVSELADKPAGGTGNSDRNDKSAVTSAVSLIADSKTASAAHPGSPAPTASAANDQPVQQDSRPAGNNVFTQFKQAQPTAQTTQGNTGEAQAGDNSVADKPVTGHAESRAAESAVRQETTAAGETQAAKTEKSSAQAATASVKSDGQQVSVQVSLSSLNKPTKTQSKTDTVKAVKAFSTNSQATGHASLNNDFMQALSAAAGEKGMKDLVEVTLTEKGTVSGELLAQTESIEQDQKPGTGQLQGGLRSEALTARQSAVRGEQVVQYRPVQTASQAEAFEKIVSTARLIRAGATSELSIKLEPDHLGLMRVQMKVDDSNVLHARIQVETYEARTLIESRESRWRNLAWMCVRTSSMSSSTVQAERMNGTRPAADSATEVVRKQRKLTLTTPAVKTVRRRKCQTQADTNTVPWNG